MTTASSIADRIQLCSSQYRYQSRGGRYRRRLFLRVTTRVITTCLSALMTHLSCFMNSVLIGFPIILLCLISVLRRVLCFISIHLVLRESRYCREQQTAYSFHNPTHVASRPCMGFACSRGLSSNASSGFRTDSQRCRRSRDRAVVALAMKSLPSELPSRSLR